MCTCHQIKSVVATSSMLICHYWSPYLFEREVCFGGSTYWFGTLEDQVWEDFNCPNYRLSTLSNFH
jgi:hypothetical protein